MTDQALTLRVTVGNRGSGSSGPTTLTYYRSDDSTITPADTEVGTDGVTGLGASESSAESILTYAPSAPGAYYYGACVDSMPGESDTTNNCSAVAAATVSEFDIDSLPWVADGITGDERRAMDQIRAFGGISPSMSQRVAGSLWLSDGVTEDELWMLAGLRDFAGSHPEIAVLVTTVPDQTGRLMEAVLSSLRWILSSDPGRSEQFLGQSWFQDGLTQEEAALIVVLRDAADSKDVFRDLLQGGHVQSDTISLPLAGEVDLFAVARSELWLEGALERMMVAAEVMEGFMGTPWPQPDVIMLLELESDMGYGSAGWNSGTHVVAKNTSTNTTYHELAHFYFGGNVPWWLSEGSADFLMLHINRLTGDEWPINSFYIDDRRRILEECAPHGSANVQGFIESGAGDSYCPYLLGRQFLRGIYRTLGHEVVSYALRELYETGESTGGQATEDEIYRAFLTNTPSSQRNDFQLWYHCLHGRPIPGYTAAPEPAAPPDNRDALAALYNATNGPGWKNSENWLSEVPLGEWYGVATDCDGSVIGLRLVHNQLTGPIPPELGKLSNLIELSLWGNQLTGPIPPELGSLSELGVLELADNQLTGPIPLELGRLTNLWDLLLGGNRLTGPIPSWVGDFSNLLALFLADNQLTGPIPPELGNLSALEYLYLSDNRLTGCVPATLKAIENNDIEGLGLEVCGDS